MVTKANEVGSGGVCTGAGNMGHSEDLGNVAEASGEDQASICLLFYK